MADLKDRNDVPQAGGVNGKRDIIVAPNLYRWAAEGKVFEAGYGLEDTAIDSEGSATVNATTATFSLQAPSSSSLLVIPLLLKLCITTEGGAVAYYQLMFTKPAGLCATSMTLSGTALTSKHCLYRTGGEAKAVQQSTALSTVTVSALVAADYVSYHRATIADNSLTTLLPAMGTGPSNVQTFNFMQDGVPHIMTSGAAMIVYAYNATTDTAYTAYMQWAEVTKDDLY